MLKKLIALLLVVLIFFFYNNEFKNNIENFKKGSSKEEILSETMSNEKSNVPTTTNIKNFKNIKLGDSLDNVVLKIGEPGRIDSSEYDFNWYVYNQYGANFAMVGIKENVVVALYSNSINSCESENINLDQNRDYVRENYSTIEYKKKGNTKYMIDSQDQFDIIKSNKKYITIFYDIYEDNRICSYQIIDDKSENSLEGIYASESKQLKESFELQIRDLTNSVRMQRELNMLKYSENATESSRKHSQDMLEKDFFDHVNKNNESPFDRMKKEGVVYKAAAENIAAGQTSAIYAHEAWMNSEGHRKNILGNYNYIGVGVKFGGYYKIYYTQNFYHD